jgi:ACS family sodium-dependent inorganic phosphate cotransporter
VVVTGEFKTRLRTLLVDQIIFKSIVYRTSKASITFTIPRNYNYEPQITPTRITLLFYFTMPARHSPKATSGNPLWLFTSAHYRSLLSSSKHNALTTTSFSSLAPRHLVVLLCFLATLTAYVERTGFSIAYTSMAHDASLDEATKGAVLSAFFWGYALSQIPGGWAAHKYGGDTMLSISFFLWSTASILTPGSASNVKATILARLCVGVAQGFLIPSVHTVLSIWIPATERARAVSLTTSGMYLGSALAMEVLPILARHMGPPFLLRFVGVVGLLWLAAWRATNRRLTAVTNSTKLPVLSGAAIGIVAGGGLGGIVSNSNTDNSNSSGTPLHNKNTSDRLGAAMTMTGRPGSTPWKAMLTSPALWAIVTNNFTFHYAFYVIMNWLPTYFDSLLGTPIAALGPAKCLPYLAMFAASNAGGWAGDALIINKMATVGGARKLVNTVGFWTTAGALLLFSSAQGVAAGIFCTTLCLATAGFARGGFSVNHMDIAPKYAGVVMGISNTAGTVAGMIGVAATGELLQWGGGAGEREGWRLAPW